MAQTCWIIKLCRTLLCFNDEEYLGCCATLKCEFTARKPVFNWVWAGYRHMLEKFLWNTDAWEKSSFIFPESRYFCWRRLQRIECCSCTVCCRNALTHLFKHLDSSKLVLRPAICAVCGISSSSPARVMMDVTVKQLNLHGQGPPAWRLSITGGLWLADSGSHLPQRDREGGIVGDGQACLLWQWCRGLCCWRNIRFCSCKGSRRMEVIVPVKPQMENFPWAALISEIRTLCRPRSRKPSSECVIEVEELSFCCCV